MEELAALNPCIKFIIDNYDMLCIAHRDKVVMTMNQEPILNGIMCAPGAYVAKIFDSMIEAMSYTQSMDMGHIPYALKECNGSDVFQELLFSVGCKTPN